MKKCFLGLLLCLCFSELKAQENLKDKTIDSLLIVLKKNITDTSKILILNRISLKYSESNPKKGIIFGKKALELSKKIKWNDGIASSYLNIGINNYDLGEMEVSYHYYNLALKATIDKKIIADAYRYLGANCIAKANYTLATSYTFKSLKLYETLNNKIGIANAYNNLAIINFYTEESNKSIFYFKKSLQLNQFLNRKNQTCAALNGIGANYEFLYKYVIAMSYYKEALKIAKEINNLTLISTINFSIAKQLLELKQPKKALVYIIKAREIAVLIQNSRLICTTNLLEARIYIGIYKIDIKTKNHSLLVTALPLVQNAINITKKSNNIVVLSEAYNTLSEIYSLQNRHKEAKESYVLYVKLQDSIYSEDTKETIQNLEDQRTIDQKNNQIKLNKITLAAKEKQKLFYILGILLLTATGSLLFFQSKNRQKTNQKLQVLNTNLNKANQTKAMFFGILNHDLRSPVYNLIHFLHLQKNNPELLDEQSKKEIQNQTLTAVENLLVSMEDMLLWGKGQMDNFKPELKSVLINDVFNDIKNHFGSEQNLTLNFQNLQNLAINTDENYLQTIIRNLTSNAIKAMASTAQPIINYSAYKNNDSIYITVTDNGKGASNNQFKALYDDSEVIGIKSGLGLHLIRDLAEAINCKITVQSKLNLGTTFELKFLDNNKHIA